MKVMVILGLWLCLKSGMMIYPPHDNLAGTYKTEEEGVTIVVTKTATGFVGVDPQKRIVLKDVKFLEGCWRGTVYNPQKDITARCEVYVEGNKLKIVAYKGLLSKTVYWVKT